MADGDELVIPDEGYSTLVIQYTKRELDRLRLVITHLRQRGQSEESIRAEMQKKLVRFDAHTLDRIYRRSLGESLPDDLAADNIVSEAPVKANTIAVEVRELLPQLHPHSLVQLRGEEWFVQRIEGKRYILKKVL
jgi:hypothetical protein